MKYDITKDFTSLKYVFFDLDDTWTIHYVITMNPKNMLVINELLKENSIGSKEFWIQYQQTEPTLMNDFLDNKIPKEIYRQRRFSDTFRIYCK